DNPWALPDLIVIDGGKGQLGRVVALMRDLGLQVGPDGLDVVSLAKERTVELGRNRVTLEQLRRVSADAAGRNCIMVSAAYPARYRTSRRQEFPDAAPVTPATCSWAAPRRVISAGAGFQATSA
ncbi:MAG TPA: hypothetical protein PKC18_03460, partial [Lacipirellulaceae bacterium]|nr:hypothetical protein [Lacipirellulaceae bacterium]